MTDLVTLAEAKAHLRVDSDADDTWLAIFIPAISAAVLSWLKDDWRAYETMVDSNGDPIEDSNGDQFPVLDSNGDPATVLPHVKAAALVELGQQYRFRDGSGAEAVPSHEGHGYVLGRGATALLQAKRKTTVR